MIKKGFLLIAILLILISIIYIQVFKEQEYEYLVGYSEQVTYQKVRDDIENTGGKVVEHLPSIYVIKVILNENERRKLSNLEDIEYVEKNSTVKSFK